LIHRPHPALPRLGAALDALLGVPAACDWHRYIKLDGDALGNDQHGCCVECGAFRRIQVARAVVAGDTRKPTADQALRLYRQWGPWDGTKRGDIGTASDRAAVLWATYGVWWCDQLEDVPSIAWLDAPNLAHLRAAIALLGPIQMDLNLPASIQSQTVWDVVDSPDSEPGSFGPHRACMGKYDGSRFYVITWGIEMPVTPAFIMRYALNAEATVSRSWLNTMGISPPGLDLTALERESRALVA
jgi:hypothetical protein